MTDRISIRHQLIPLRKKQIERKGNSQTARIASSKTFFSPFCVSAEHSRYFTAEISLCICTPAAKGIGCIRLWITCNHQYLDYTLEKGGNTGRGGDSNSGGSFIPTSHRIKLGDKATSEIPPRDKGIAARKSEGRKKDNIPLSKFVDSSWVFSKIELGSYQYGRDPRSMMCDLGPPLLFMTHIRHSKEPNKRASRE